MRSRSLPILGWLVFVSSLVGSACGDEGEVDYNRDVRSVLTAQCYACHGPDENVREAGLRLDVREQAVSELDSGERAVVPGNVEQSELLRRVASEDPDYRMPPPEFGPPLSKEKQKLLRQWIEQGAKFARHWSLVRPTSVRVPVSGQTHNPAMHTDLAAWPRRAVDAFVLSRLHKEELRPSPSADRYALIRRVTLDLTGLPPTIAQVDAFVQDSDPHAYEQVVDRLLASPAFGERWARIWLDLARYADSAGYADDPPRTIWRYRDWVIESLNAGKTFDRFTIEQLAGDLLPEAGVNERLATAFHRNTMTNSEGGTDDEEFRVAAIVDRVNTTMQVWMGLTMGCAQCHTHKYDPITQKEYYQTFAIFNNTADADLRDEAPTIPTPSVLQQIQQHRLKDQIQQWKQKLQTSSDENAANKTEATNQIAALEKQLAAIKPVTTPVMQELAEKDHRTTNILIRGNFLDKGEPVTPGTPAALHDFPQGVSTNRMGFAQWLVDPSNPLTSRVLVNRLWEHLFGIGLVETSEDFGVQGETPSHPKLLDWLALQMLQRKWDIKHFLRLIVTSSTYRQSSRSTKELIQRDPRNRLLARGPRFRLDAEMIRDQALFAAGLLSPKMYGPPAQPPRPVLGLKAAFGSSTDWKTSPGEDKFRRGVYTYWRRSSPYPSMDAFDAPSREFCTVRRIRTNTPIQALVTLNDPVYIEAAQALARRTMAEGGTEISQRAAYAFRLCVARPARAEELSRLTALYQRVFERFQDSPQQAKEFAGEVELAAWTVVANVLLNLDETIAKR